MRNLLRQSPNEGEVGSDAQEQIATYRFENKRLDPAMSCDGEPAPDRVLFAMMPPGRPKGDLLLGAVGSIGEFPLLGDWDLAA